MPIYEFHCEDCNNSFETLIRAGHDDDAQCPLCSGGNLSREMSIFASSRGAVSGPGPGQPAMARRGGCCGGSCGCG